MEEGKGCIQVGETSIRLHVYAMARLQLMSLFMSCLPHHRLEGNTVESRSLCFCQDF